MTEITRRTPAASMNYLADQLEAALNGDPKQLHAKATAIVIALRSAADAKAIDDLTKTGEILRTALDAESVPAEQASRIWNRFFFGQPEGLASR